MSDLTIACVRQGQKYGPEYVEKLRDGVARHLDRPHRFVCLSDSLVPEGVEWIPIDGSLSGWWAKMRLFSPALRAASPGRWVYLDLDTVVCGPLDPLVDLDVDFGVCANFTRAVDPTYPCRYGSCVMTFADGWGKHIWDEFSHDACRHMARAGSYGDQLAVERIHPNAELLQDHLPRGFFLGRRDITPTRPPEASLVIFAGNTKPHNASTPDWIKREW